jgi:hypothetical protein
MNSPLCDLEGKDRAAPLSWAKELRYQTLSGRFMLRDLQTYALGPIVDVVRLLRDNLEDSTASNPSLTCCRNDGQGHGLCATLMPFCGARVSPPATEFLARCVIHARKNFGSPFVRSSSSPHFSTVHVHMLF